jgi:carbon storage regulator
MLVLGRKPGERVFVGDDIEVVVVEVRGNRVKLGFNAPDYLPIQRGEIHEMEGWYPALAEAECA